MATHGKKHIQIKGTNELIRITNPKNQYYAIITAPEGDCRFKCTLLNGEEKQVSLPGRLKGRTRNKMINPGDFVLIERDNINAGNPTYWILTKYSKDDRNKLKKMGENVDSTNSEMNDIFNREQEEEDDEIDIDDI